MIMKKILLLTVLIMTGSLIIWSQVPQAMTYKAVAKDDWGVALPNKTIALRFTILQGSGTGSIVYQETHTTTTNKFGLMDVEIGKGTPAIGSFDLIDWSTGIYYIQIEMDPNGGTNFRLEDPGHQLLSVPYALFAESSGNSSFTETDPFFVASPSSGIWNTDISNWNTAFGWGNHADAGYLNSFTETDPIFLPHPAFGIASEDINNWNTAFGWGDHTGLYKPLSWMPSWSEITENPFLISSPVANQLLRYNAVTERWENWLPDFLTNEVDGSVSNELQSLSQILDLGNDAAAKNIINLADPINSQDAATKAYVDALEARILALESAVNALIGLQDDEDDDGFTIAEGDCNDHDASIFPGATEICGDGIDQDCDGSDLPCSYSLDCFPVSADPIPTMVRLINEKRIQRALSPLAPDPRLILAAQKHAEYLDELGTVSHIGANESTFYVRCSDEGYTPAIGELVAMGFSDPTVTFNEWFNDSLPTVNHHDIILLQNAKHLGVGYDEGFWVVDFGAATDGPTCVVENDNDSDGYTVNEGDCNDNDATIYPGAIEICGDGIDQDCDGSDLECIMDSDGDGISDSSDNCPSVANPDQADTDGDGIGDMCDDFNPADPVVDNDGNTYQTVQIGNQIWMAENLKTTRYNDNTSIPLVSDNTEWSNLSTPGYCWYNNDEGSYKEDYGALYNWFAINTDKLCPIGWRVPIMLDWETLVDFVGDEATAGGPLKESGFLHWSEPNTGATNSSGFTARGGSWRNNVDGTFGIIGVSGVFYSSNDYEGMAEGISFSNTSINVVFPYASPKRGYSIRCIKDNYAVDDLDGDGFTVSQGDCDDYDFSINPDATDICGDGIDQDCNGSDLICVDNDNDGWAVSNGDCDDSNAEVHPGKEEIIGDGIDNDCNGAIDDVESLKINEVDCNQPGTDNEEFVELYNYSNYAITLLGWKLDFINGSDLSVYRSIDLSSAGTIPVNGFLTILFGDIPVPPDGNIIKVEEISAIQNGPDAIIIKDIYGEIIDALAYGDFLETPYFLEGVPSVLDIGDGAYSLGRYPNGADTNNNLTDFNLMAPTPGLPNVK